MKKIAVLGPEGTFSDNAAREYLKSEGIIMERMYFPTIDEAFHSVGRECDCGIIPMENTLDGYVQRTIDLLSEENVHIAKEILIPVQFSLLADCAGVNEIKRLFVQFKAAGQCRRFADGLKGVSVVATESNMESYYRFKNGIRGDAAIVPTHIAKDDVAGLKIDNITDSESNFTRFIVIEPGESKIKPKKDRQFKASVYITPEVDRPGMLFEILSAFYGNRINLVSIISRPTKKEMGTYNFYIETKGDFGEKEAVIKALDEIKKNYGIKVMGIYSV